MNKKWFGDWQICICENHDTLLLNSTVYEPIPVCVSVCLTVRALHYEIWTYCQSTSRVQAQVLQNLRVHWLMQVNENTDLLVRFRDNILGILQQMNGMQGVMSQMPALPVRLNVELANNFLPKAGTPPLFMGMPPMMAPGISPEKPPQQSLHPYHRGMPSCACSFMVWFAHENPTLSQSRMLPCVKPPAMVSSGTTVRLLQDDPLPVSDISVVAAKPCLGATRPAAQGIFGML